MGFGYEVVHLWEEPLEPLLNGPAEITPLSVLARLPTGVPEEDALAEVIRRVIERLLSERPPDRSRRLLTAAFVLTGLRVPRHVARQLFSGVQAMQESDTYLAILDEGAERGRLEEIKKVIVFLGEEKLGPPSESFKTALNAIEDLARLERLARQVHRISTWAELLDLP
jgi:hypothetical protein